MKFKVRTGVTIPVQKNIRVPDNCAISPIKFVDKSVDIYLLDEHKPVKVCNKEKGDYEKLPLKDVVEYNVEIDNEEKTVSLDIYHSKILNDYTLFAADIKYKEHDTDNIVDRSLVTYHPDKKPEHLSKEESDKIMSTVKKDKLILNDNVYIKKYSME